MATINPNWDTSLTFSEREMAKDILYAGQTDMVVPYPNPSGLRPTENKLLVLPDPIEEKSKGGIIYADSTRDSEKFKTVRGRIIECSPLAFNYATDEEWDGKKPKAGDVVVYAKFGGMWIKGVDGIEYLLLNDKDLIALVDE